MIAWIVLLVGWEANNAGRANGLAPLDCDTLLDSFENDLRYVTRERSIQTRGFVLSLADEGYSTLEQEVVTDLAGLGDAGLWPSSRRFFRLASIRDHAVLASGDAERLVEAIQHGAPLSEFRALLDSAGVDVGSTWVSLFPFQMNLAIVAVANVRPSILQFLIGRGVDPVPEGFSTLDGIAHALNHDGFSLPQSELSVALSDIVKQLVDAGARAHAPSTVNTIRRALPGAGEVPLRADVERAATAPRVIKASQALASLDANWNTRVEIGARIETECIGKAPDVESRELLQSLAAKMRFDDAVERQQQRYFEQIRRLLERHIEAISAGREEAVAAIVPMYEAILEDRWEDVVEPISAGREEPVATLVQVHEAMLDDRWEDVVELMDTTHESVVREMASGILSNALADGAPIDVMGALIEHNGGHLPPDAILALVKSGTDGSVDIARHLEQRHKMDVHFVDEDGRNAFSVVVDGATGRRFYEFSDVDGRLRVSPDPYILEWVHYLSDRHVTPKPYRWGLDPLDRLLKKMVDLPLVAAVGIEYVRLLIDQGAPVESSHLELADRLFEEAPALHRALIECVPELSVGKRSTFTARTETASNREKGAAR